MGVVKRGIGNAFRNKIRTGSIILILSLSIGLVIAMLAARQAVSERVADVKSSVGNTISISPAGVRGFEGGGEPLTAEQVSKIQSASNVVEVSSILTDRLTTGTTTTLQSSIEPGTFGMRRATENSTTTEAMPTRPGGATARPNPSTSVTITGTDDTSQASTFGGNTLSWVSGSSFDAKADKNEVVIGKALAEKNNLTTGSTFTAYGATMTVVGVYDAGTTFANNGVFTSLTTLQRISSQTGSVTSATAIVDSADNLATATTAITSALGDAVDVTNNQQTADATIQPLESVMSITTYSLVGAIIAGSVIVLLTMIMIVRERRREIGVMKAIGGSNIGIMSQFIVEAITLTALALIVGTAAGVIASAPITDALVANSTSTSTQAGPGGPGGGRAARNAQTTVANIQSSVGTDILAYGLGATLLIAVIGSALPSLMISKIKPAEAMRSE